MQVLIDGRSVYLPPFGGVDWQDLPIMIDDIERIEVVRGPAAASHGTNSFYGVINIISRDASSVNAKSVSVSQGGMGVSDVSAHLGAAGEHLDYRFSFGYRSDGGDNPQVLNDTSTNRLLNLRTNYRPDTENSIDLQLGWNDGVYGSGTAGRPEDAFRDVRTSNDFQQVGWTHTWPGRDESKLTFYRISRNLTDPYKCIKFLTCKGETPLPLVAGFGQDVMQSQRQELELQNTTQLGASNRAVWGGGVRYDYANQPYLFPAAKSLHQSRIFAHDEWRVTEAALVNAGAMYEDDGAGHKNTSPRLSINYHLVPQHTLRASISSATRNPMMAEKDLQTSFYGYWKFGNTPALQDIGPEKIIAKEIGYVGQFDSISVDGRIYYDKVRDIILIDYGADLPNYANSFKNMAEATYKGIDLSATYRWNEGKATVNYSRQKSICGLSAYPTQYFSTVPVPGTMPPTTFAQLYQTDYLDICGEAVPANSGSMLLSQNLSETYQFSIGYYFRSKVRVTDVGSSFPGESQMRRVDMRVASIFGQKEKAGGGEIALVLQNAFQDNYTGYGNVPGRVNLLFKRRTYLTATIYF
jgi:iron complex outermembrane receptor protein